MISLFLRLPHICLRCLLFCSLLHIPYMRPVTLSMLHRIRVFNSTEHVILDKKSCRNAFWTKIMWQRILCSGKKYQIKDKTRELQHKAHVFKDSSITVQRFPVNAITSHMLKQHTVADRAIKAWILETVFLQKPIVTLLLPWISYHLCSVLDVLPSW